MLLLVIHVNVQVRGLSPWEVLEKLVIGDIFRLQPKDRSNGVKTVWFFDMDILTYVTWLFVRLLPGEGFEDVSFDVFVSVTDFLMDQMETSGP